MPNNIGYDPYRAWKTLCHDCGSEGNFFDDNRKFLGIKKDIKVGDRIKRCGGCGRWQQIRHAMDRLRAFHLNDIRWRKTTLSEKDAIN